MLDVARVTEEEWRSVRSLRLAALAESPSAFGSSLERELAFDEATWRARLANLESGTFLARRLPAADPSGGGAVGLASGVRLEGDAASVRALVGMWVAPDARRLGAGSALVRAVLAWAIDSGATRVRLGVAEGNEGARRLYEACGFSPTGERAPYPGRPGLVEVAMAIDLEPR